VKTLGQFILVFYAQYATSLGLSDVCTGSSWHASTSKLTPPLACVYTWMSYTLRKPVKIFKHFMHLFFFCWCVFLER